MEYESPVDGTLLKIVVPAGGMAKVGELIAVVGDQGEDISAVLAADVAAVGGATEPAADVPSRAGTLTAESTAAVSTAAVSTAAESSPIDRASGPPRVKASPLARRLAGERGLDLSAVTGSGPGGRIVQRDIEASASVPAAASPAGSAGLVLSAEDTLVPVTGKRKVIAQRLSESKFQAPHYYLKLSVTMDGLMASRSKLNASQKERVSLNAYFIKFAAESLKRFPDVNSSWEGASIRRFAKADIGLAVAVSDGLITPVVRDCGNRGIREIDRELSTLIEKAKGGKLLPEEYKGATFTISNLGTFGIEDFTAIINPPGSAILTLGSIRREAVVVDAAARDTSDPHAADGGGTPLAGGGVLVVRSRMRMGLSCDHRVIDGVVGAAFLAEMKEMMENPIRVLY